ncbi:hypothetical protein ACFORH_08140 [Amycolatopsis roodepoortensis]|uniref:Uncharacterized protein n=1 Tax=Amycolatopsis roodepoortensis TaxID=700274 RepID=A0ABR9L9B7_9PSEU|nr:hypothetical protein [Amycolatopsis roodepoortensis]MBE1577132.1 hypothetical protein [Amycolatopsis roodepoortensis]
MEFEAGQRLLAFLRELQAVKVADSTWGFGGPEWEAVVDVVPHRWLALAFEALDPVTGKRATYDIDTDLYDLTRDDQRGFAEEIERDIIEFLDNLKRGAVLRGNHGKKFVLVFPLDGAYVRVVQGRFAGSASTYPDLATALAGGDYVPLSRPHPRA